MLRERERGRKEKDLYFSPFNKIRFLALHFDFVPYPAVL